MTEKPSFLTQISEVLRAQLKTVPSDKFQKTTTALPLWEKVVGKTIAQKSEVLFVKNDVLYVGVSSSAWLHELALQKQTILESFNKLAPELCVKDIKMKMVKEEKTS